MRGPLTLAERPLQTRGERQVRPPGDEIDKLSWGLSGWLYPLPVSDSTVPVVVQRLIQWTMGAYRCALIRSRESTGVRPTLARWSAFDPHRRAEGGGRLSG